MFLFRHVGPNPIMVSALRGEQDAVDTQRCYSEGIIENCQTEERLIDMFSASGIPPPTARFLVLGQWGRRGFHNGIHMISALKRSILHHVCHYEHNICTSQD
ncbi:derlin-3 [Platysternon megacephalum]|uniref:Derlin-3 n=1 Tax=Platysternon megacephalum TaxID=55544 RepID=A0A4D9F4M5_9SAUR|nr:derlin-3 [Platysternon megacephalum]